MKISSRFIVCFASLILSIPHARAVAATPTVAVYGFSEAGISNWWGSSVDPGAALAELLTVRLVNLPSVTVVDREHVKSVLAEQRTSEAGQVTPSTEIELGHMLGVKYLFVGKIVQLDKTNGIGGIAVPKWVPGGGAVGQTKATLKVTMDVIEANSGRVVQALETTQSSTATTFAVAGFVPGAGAGAYTSQEFQSSAMGKLITAAADDLAKKVDLAKPGPVAPAISGRVLDIDASTGSITLNVGSDRGVEVGMMFSVVTTKQLIDPDTHKTIVSEIPRGTIQVTSVTKDSSIAKKVTGIVKTMDTVHLEQ